MTIENTLSQSGIPAEAVEITESGDVTTADSATETKLEELDPSHQGEEDNTDGEEKEVPFHEHPRWKEIISQNKTLSKTLQEIRDEREADRSQLSAMMKAFEALQVSKNDELDPRFKEVVGDDDNAKAFYEYMKEMISQEKELTKKEVLEELLKSEQQQKSQVDSYQQAIDSKFSEMEDEGLKFDRDEVLKFAKENASDGYLLDFKVAHKLLNEVKQAKKVQEAASKKEKASLVSSQSTTTPASDTAFDKEAWKNYKGPLANFKKFIK